MAGLLSRMTIGDKIWQCRELKGLTRPELAALVGLSAKSIQRIETGEMRKAGSVPKGPQGTRLQKFADALGVPIGYFTDKEATEPPTAASQELKRRVDETIKSIGYQEAWDRLIFRAVRPTGFREVPFDADPKP